MIRPVAPYRTPQYTEDVPDPLSGARGIGYALMFSMLGFIAPAVVIIQVHKALS